MSSLRTLTLRPARIKPTLRLTRLQYPSPIYSSRAASSLAAEPQPSFFRRAASFVGRGALFTALGFIMAIAPAYQTVQQVLKPPSDAETLTLYVPTDPAAEEVEAYINNHPVIAALRADPTLTESRPHMKIPPAFRASNLTAGTLLGPGRVTVPPFAWADGAGREFVQVCHVGRDLCGHPGVVHGGFLATVLDEGLARCCFAALPHQVGMTASLTVNYRAPAPADTYMVLRARTTKVEGRKAWVAGRIETLVGEGETPVVLAEAEALYISPKHAAMMPRLYSSSS